MQLTMKQLFGEGASQTVTSLIIQKSTLRGLTPLINNRAQQLFSAVLFNALQIMSGNLTNELEEILTDENNISLDFDNSQIFTELTIFEWDIKFLLRQQAKYIKNTIVIQQYEMV